MAISLMDVETGVVAPGQLGTPTVKVATGFTAGGSGSQSFTTASTGTVTATAGPKSHHHE